VHAPVQQQVVLHVLEIEILILLLAPAQQAISILKNLIAYVKKKIKIKIK
jgi:hypothetical protein